MDAAHRLGGIRGVVVDAEPELSLFPFHVTRPGWSVEHENAATRRLIDGVTRRGRVMITGCETKGRFYARVCVLSFRTHQPQIDALVEDVEDAIGR